MKWKHPLFAKALGFASAVAIPRWLSTLDSKIAYYDPTVDPVYPGSERYIYLQWHEYLLYPFTFRPFPHVALLISQHGDADILTRYTEQLGFSIVRGSTKRGGATAIGQMLRVAEDHHLLITPDGPRGPRRELSPGPIFLASKSGRPIVCVGAGFNRPWRLGSWDQFAVARPFSRGRVVFGPPTFVPPKLDRSELEAWRLQIEQQLTHLTQEAEAWAESGSAKQGEYPLLSGRLPETLLRRHGPHPVARPAWMPRRPLRTE